TDLELEPDAPFATQHCGTCTRCIDACPTQAIIPGLGVDARKCISYLTIELKDELIPADLAEKMDGWMFGCDICQDVCPWNRFSTKHQQPAFQPIQQILEWDLADWLQQGEATFSRVFKHSPLKRSKWKGILRNLTAIKAAHH
ncbi:MAG: tRNA epoxyqueuosine(34) reductase QueG, partial [Chitinophagia bacterium]|nr:tRNA epoxyqueuosine(34) reductase QueG [Chitinophagia bacterium]